MQPISGYCIQVYQPKQFIDVESAHTDPPAARAVRSSSKRSPSFPEVVRVSLINDGPPETNSSSNALLTKVQVCKE